MKQESIVELLKKRHKHISKDNNFWHSHYQLVSEYMFSRRQNFNETNQPGAFLHNDIFTSLPQNALQVAASTVLGALWPNAAKTIKIVKPPRAPDTEEVKDYYNKQTERLTHYMDDPSSGLLLALQDYMLDVFAFGSSAVAVFAGDDINQSPLSYQSWSLKEMSFDEDEKGFIDTVHRREKITIRNLVRRFGLENISAESLERYNNGDEEGTVEILHAIEPRLPESRLKFGSPDMPVASIHFEWNTGHILRESGFMSMPVIAARFYKAMNEVRGRSPAMMALPAVIQLNIIRQAYNVACEKTLNPPLWMLNDGVPGGFLDRSAGANNILNPSPRNGSSAPVGTLYTVGDMRFTDNLMEKLENEITQCLLLDRLLDLNNETTMTAAETQIRERLRGESLAPIYARQKVEFFTPLVERSYSVVLDTGLLGVVKDSPQEAYLKSQGVRDILYIPQDIVNLAEEGEQRLYDIEYLSPAEHIMNSYELKGIYTMVDFISQNAAAIPEAIDNLESDDAIKLASELTGVPKRMIASKESVQKKRQARAEMQQQQMEIEAQRSQSEVARNMAQAQATIMNQQQQQQKGRAA